MHGSRDKDELMGLRLSGNPDLSKRPLRSIRRALDMTLGEMARAARMTPSALSAMERGTRKPTEVEVLWLCHVVERRLKSVLMETD